MNLNTTDSPFSHCLPKILMKSSPTQPNLEMRNFTIPPKTIFSSNPRPSQEKTINHKHANPANNLHKTESHFTGAEARSVIHEYLIQVRNIYGGGRYPRTLGCYFHADV